MRVFLRRATCECVSFVPDKLEREVEAEHIVPGTTQLESQAISIQDSGEVREHFAVNLFVDASSLSSESFFFFQHQEIFSIPVLEDRL